MDNIRNQIQEDLECSEAFLDHLEKAGMIEKLEQASEDEDIRIEMWEEICKMFREWIDEGMEG